MSFHFIDWLVLSSYILLIFFVAFRASKDVMNSSDDNASEMAQKKFMASKSLTFTESICSTIATEVSALTFLGIPAFAYNTNFNFLQIYIGAILGRYVIAKIFLPKIYDQGLTVNEVMVKETGLPSGQRTVAIFYTLSKILSVGVRLFSGSILVSHFLQVNLYIGLAVVTFVTFLYTLIGGLKAVVRTDILQMGLFIMGGLVAHYMIPVVSERSWLDMMTVAYGAGKTSFMDFSNPLPLILGLMGGILFDMSTHGVDQDYAQRLTANRSLEHGQKAIFYSSFISILVGVLFLGIGALLWVHYQSAPFPENVANADHLFSHFIVTYFPPGIRGLMVAGVLAATMSTLDSTINALCATLYNDILPQRDARRMRLFTFIDTLVITILIFMIAAIASKNDGLLMLGLKIQSWTGSSLLGIFLTKLIFKKWFPYRLTISSVIGAYCFGSLGVFINSQILDWNWNLNVYWGCFMSMLFLKFYSTLYPFNPTKP
jgi:solute:Na+ symporter, SSS family